MSDSQPNQMHLRPQGQAGSALLPVMLLMFLFSAIAIGMAVVVRIEISVAMRFVQATQALHAADAAVALALSELRAMGDWTPVLTGAVQSVRSDGIFAGRKISPAAAPSSFAAVRRLLRAVWRGNPRWLAPSPGGHCHGGPSSGLRWRRSFPARRWAASTSWCSWRMTRVKRMGMGRQMRTGGWS